MNSRNFMSFLVMTIALFVFAIAPASAEFADIDGGSITVNGIIAYDGQNVQVFAGDTLAVRVVFTAFDSDEGNEEDVRVIARILGEPGLSEATERFDVIRNGTYSRLIHIDLPNDLDDELDEPFTLRVTVESNSDTGGEISINLVVQRVNNLLEVLLVETDETVQAGDVLPVTVVVKNRGRDKARDTLVSVKIPELGVTKTIFLDDLYAQDTSGNDEDDARAGVLFLNIPRDAPAGVYDMEIKAFNDDSTTIVTRRIVIVSGSEDSSVVSSATSKTFAAGEDRTYTVTIVNADNRIRVYELILEAANGLRIDLSESVVAVPAGTSKTVQLTVMASEEGTYNFAVNVHSEGELVKKQSFVANVEGEADRAGGNGANAAVVLTIILAIIFVVLLIVLIVLLTRKPEKTEDFGESYY